MMSPTEPNVIGMVKFAIRMLVLTAYTKLLLQLGDVGVQDVRRETVHEVGKPTLRSSNSSK